MSPRGQTQTLVPPLTDCDRGKWLNGPVSSSGNGGKRSRLKAHGRDRGQQRLAEPSVHTGLSVVGLSSSVCSPPSLPWEQMEIVSRQTRSLKTIRFGNETVPSQARGPMCTKVGLRFPSAQGAEGTVWEDGQRSLACGNTLRLFTVSILWFSTSCRTDVHGPLSNLSYPSARV